MKTLSSLALVAVLVAVSATRSLAYYHDDRGWYDSHHHRHAFIYYHNHRGYWDHDPAGVRIFINI